jgi:hypothetical protein
MQFTTHCIRFTSLTLVTSHNTFIGNQITVAEHPKDPSLSISISAAASVNILMRIKHDGKFRLVFDVRRRGKYTVYIFQQHLQYQDE